MAYEILAHTADVGIAASAGDLAELFVEAARAMASVVLDADPPSAVEADGAAPVEVSGDDVAGTLAEFLEECLYRFEVYGTLVIGARLSVTDTLATGEILTRAGLLSDGPQIKAVTYHQLKVESGPDGWRAVVYFDV